MFCCYFSAVCQDFPRQWQNMTSPSMALWMALDLIIQVIMLTYFLEKLFSTYMSGLLQSLRFQSCSKLCLLCVFSLFCSSLCDTADSFRSYSDHLYVHINNSHTEIKHGAPINPIRYWFHNSLKMSYFFDHPVCASELCKNKALCVVPLFMNQIV